MHGSQGIMVDNHLNLRVQPEGEAWLSTIIPMATVHQVIHTLPDLLVHYHSYKPI